MRIYLHLFLFVTLVCMAENLQAQLDSIHWLPPMHGRDELGPQFLYVSTPETTPFAVTITDGGGNFKGTVTISNAQPARVSIDNISSTIVLALENELHQALTNKGLILTGPQKFYVNLRFQSSS